MLRWPGTIEPGIREPAVSSIDIAPTILHAAGMEVPPEMSGIDLLPLANGALTPDRIVYGEVFAHDMANLSDPHQSLLYSWCFDGRWKLIQTFDGKTGRYGALHPQTNQPLELFDLQADPSESYECGGAHPDQQQRLKRSLDHWRSEMSLIDPQPTH